MNTHLIELSWHIITVTLILGFFAERSIRLFMAIRLSLPRIAKRTAQWLTNPFVAFLFHCAAALTALTISRTTGII